MVKRIQHNEWSMEQYLYSKNTKFFDKQIAEFNFKLLHNQLNCNYHVSKWNKEVAKNCTSCGEVEYIKHLIFECTDSKRVWEKISQVLFKSILETYCCRIL